MGLGVSTLAKSFEKFWNELVPQATLLSRDAAPIQHLWCQVFVLESLNGEQRPLCPFLFVCEFSIQRRPVRVAAKIENIK